MKKIQGARRTLWYMYSARNVMAGVSRPPADQIIIPQMIRAVEFGQTAIQTQPVGTQIPLLCTFAASRTPGRPQCYQFSGAVEIPGHVFCYQNFLLCLKMSHPDCILATEADQISVI
jgi:hypothetical protein